MKKTILVLTVLLLLLTACGTNSSNTADSPAAPEDNSTTVDQDTADEAFPGRQLTGINTLLMGTFLLEETSDAVTAEQAAEMLPLWKLAQTLTTSGTAADAEIQAVADQIQSVMTEEQIAFVTDPDLSQQDLVALLDEMGISLFPEGVEGRDGTPPEGAVPGSGQGGGFGGGVPGGGELTEEQQATAEARREAGGGGTGGGFLNNPALYDALIQLLESKIS